MSDAPRPGRGGRRPGAGRKPKSHVPPAHLSEINIAASRARPVPERMESAALRHARKAIDTLLTVMLHGKSDPARVKAAEAILDRGWGKPSAEPGGDLVLPLFPDDQVRVLAEDLRELARKETNLAFDVLSAISERSLTESAQVAASKAIIDRTIGSVGVARVPESEYRREIGKKEQAAQMADEMATDIYAVPSYAVGGGLVN